MIGVALAALLLSSQPQQPRIVWTVDDGPHFAVWPRMLRALKCHGVRATFYVLGARLTSKRNRAVLRDAVRDGHRLGNHLWSHLSPCKIGARRTLRELRRTRGKLEAMFGKGIDGKRYRPPNGSLCRSVNRAVNREGYRIIMWHVADLNLSSRAMWRRMLRRLRSGRDVVVLFHYSAAKLERVLRYAAAAGYVKGCKP